MKLFSRFFPFPNYLAMPAVGIDISDRTIKYAQLEKSSGDFKLKKFGIKNIDLGIIERGEIKQKEALLKELKILHQELNNNYIVASLPEEKAFMKVVCLPLMEEDQIKKSLELQLEEIIPFPPSEILFDFELVGKSLQKNTLEVVISAFPKKIAEDYANIFNEAGFLPVAFEIENQSVYRDLVGFNNKEGVMIIDFGKTRTGFLIGVGGAVKFSSTISVAGEQIDKVLAHGLKIDVFEAESMKKKLIFQQNGGTWDVIMPVISVIKDEAQRILEYWYTHAKEQDLEHEQVKKIFLCGGDANMLGLVDYLSYKLKQTVEMGNVWVNINDFENYLPPIERNESLMYATALGLSLRSFVNL